MCQYLMNEDTATYQLILTMHDDFFQEEELIGDIRNTIFNATLIVQ
jgi:hypothetical protein